MNALKSIQPDKLQIILNQSNSYVEVLQKLGLQTNNGNNASTLKKKIKQFNLDTSRLESNREEARKKQIASISFERSISNHEMFIKNSSSGSSQIRKRVLQDNLIEYKCQICLNKGEHLDQPLVLQLDHINGTNNDNRLENLRFLCPNCHSQTDTFAGKKEPNRCSCGNVMHRKSKNCRTCSELKLSSEPRKTKIQWPSQEKMQELVWEKPISLLANELGVSDVAIHKFCKKHGIIKPPVGFWLKK